MSKDKTGGPAFPSEHPMFRTLPDRDKGSTDMELIGGDGQRVGTCAVFMEGRMVPHTGMTLRDYFAAKAIAPLCDAHRISEVAPDAYTLAMLAADAYAIADAMLAARKEDK